MSLSQIAKETVCDSTNQLLHNYHSQNHIHQSVKTKINNETTTKVQSKPLSSPSSRSLLGNLNFGLASNRKQSNHHHILKKSVNVNNSILSPSDIKHISSYARTIDTSKKEWIIKHRRLASNLLDIFKEGITRGDKDTLLASEIRKFLRANENPEDDVQAGIKFFGTAAVSYMQGTIGKIETYFITPEFKVKIEAIHKHEKNYSIVVMKEILGQKENNNKYF
ncbi:494_t:CDS:2 [Ambispora leptoticha]|uniref:494_t:CDS:1 n=1 Tax=Ambispora leptoticha TaxID=144679 RepID=A0A9N8WGN4_9GLOM|nr:494_t:CDS:2 [Ambispora leptoticha]